MKKGILATILAGFVVLGIILNPIAANAEPEPSPAPPTRTLSVTGQARLTVKPDTAIISLGVSELKPSPAEAYQALNSSISKVSAAVQAKGIAPEQIQTSLFNLNAEYNWTQEKGQVLAGYRATNTLSITTTDLDKVADLIQAAVEAGSNQLHGISFSVKDSDGLMEQALDVAVDDAKAKAARVAGRLNSKVVRVVTVSIQDQGIPMVRAEKSMAAAPMADGMGGAPVPVFSGTTTFTATVHVTFELQ